MSNKLPRIKGYCLDCEKEYVCEILKEHLGDPEDGIDYSGHWELDSKSGGII